MREANVYNIRKSLPRMSWHPRNLFNLYNRSEGKRAEEAVFTRSNLSLFQQRWKAKKLVRAYHGDFINEKSFKRWYLPATLPDVRPRKRVFGDDTTNLESWAGRMKNAHRERTKMEEEDEMALAPVGSLMFSEVEKRIDVFIFRCCFAHSVYEARRMVVHGDVLLNGKKHQNTNTRLAPGDMVSVNPQAIRFLQEKPKESSAESPSPGEDLEKKPSEDEASASGNSFAFTLTPFHLPPYASPFLFIPAYIEVSFHACSAIYLRHPTARPGYSEIPTPFDADGEVVRLAWEWYSKVRPRMRSKSQLAQMPERRQSSGPSLRL